MPLTHVGKLEKTLASEEELGSLDFRNLSLEEKMLESKEFDQSSLHELKRPVKLQEPQEHSWSFLFYDTEETRKQVTQRCIHIYIIIIIIIVNNNNNNNNNNYNNIYNDSNNNNINNNDNNNNNDNGNNYHNDN